MHEYDTALKELLLDSAGMTLRAVTGVDVRVWRNVELPQVLGPRIDLLGETGPEELLHIELQSANDPRMAARMLRYGVDVLDRCGIFPRQTVLYVGDAPMSMKTSLAVPKLASYDYRLVDIRELDGEALCESGSIGDNVIAILARWRNRKEAVRRVLKRIAEREPSKRGKAMAQLMILAGLRRMGTEVEKEAKQMPILNDILDHEVLGREYKRGRQEGWQEGRQEGWQEGRQEAERGTELRLLRQVLENRFGNLPLWLEERLERCSMAELDVAFGRALSGSDLSQLFG